MAASGGSSDPGQPKAAASSSTRRRPPLPELDVASFAAFFSLPPNPSSTTPTTCTSSAFPSPSCITPAGAFPSPSCALAFPSPLRSPATPSTPLTIFYDGTVSVYDMPQDKAETIMRWAVAASTPPASPAAAAMKAGTPTAAAGSGQQQKPVDLLKPRDLPIAKRKSLERFLQRRKEM